MGEAGAALVPAADVVSPRQRAATLRRTVNRLPHPRQRRRRMQLQRRHRVEPVRQRALLLAVHPDGAPWMEVPDEAARYRQPRGLAAHLRAEALPIGPVMALRRRGF